MSKRAGLATLSPFVFLVALLLSVLPTATTAFQTSVTCKSDEENIALFDGRKTHIRSQCRVPCKTFSSPSVKWSTIPINCPIWNFPGFGEFHVGKAVCIPRGFCIKQCGEEKQGCVYTGACVSQTCFKSAKTENPAEPERVTYTGAGSYVKTDEGSTQEKRSSFLSSYQLHLHAESCTMFDGTIVKFTRLSDDCDGDKPFLDNRNSDDDWTQCRSLCTKFNDSSIEMHYIHFACPYCQSKNFLSHFYNEKGMCIPKEACEKACGPPHPGCVYSGTCKTQFCFYGIDSKKPAQIDYGEDDYGDHISVSVDNNRSETLIDPPFFAESPLSIDRGPPPSVPPITPSPSPNPGDLASPKPSPTASPPSSSSTGNSMETTTDEQPSTNDNESDDSDTNMWVWLGPLMGLVLAALIGFAGTVVAAIIRNRAPRGDQSTINEETFSP